jgi:hypothetical protein
MTEATRTQRLREILDAMQNAEEMGGVENEQDYEALMLAVINVASTRLDTSRANRGATAVGPMGLLAKCAERLDLYASITEPADDDDRVQIETYEDTRRIVALVNFLTTDAREPIGYPGEARSLYGDQQEG